MKRKISTHHLAFLLVVLALALAAMGGGLAKLGWTAFAQRTPWHMEHGPLMVSGFFGTLISLERAAALQKKWAYLGPILCAAGGLTLAAGLGTMAGPVLLTLGSLWLVILFFFILRQHLTLYTAVMAAGAVALLTGNLLWLLRWPIYKFVLWWVGFLVLTIAGERLELGRIREQTPLSTNSFSLITVVYVLGLVVMLLNLDLGQRVASGATVALAAWLLKYDIARFTIQKGGLTRYIAVALLSGYGWLGLSGLIGLWQGGVSAGPAYDALLHSVFIGFVFAMIFGHAPIIFPALLNIPVRYKPPLYGPLILLHLSLILRMVGDLGSLLWARQWGGMINVISILLFLVLLSPLTGWVAEKLFQTRTAAVDD